MTTALRILALAVTAPLWILLAIPGLVILLYALLEYARTGEWGEIFT
jgi:hypothetical protein